MSKEKIQTNHRNLSPARQEQIHETVRECYAYGADGNPGPIPEVRFDLHGRAAGQWRLHNGVEVLRFNPEAFVRDWDSHFPDTVAHEVAHSLVFRTARRRVRPHGPEWQNFMQRMGCQPQVTHNTPLSGRKQRVYRYECACGTHELSARRNFLIRRKGYRYQCRQCARSLKPASG